MRLYNRANKALRELILTPSYATQAEGSCLIQLGNTKVLCIASVLSQVPPFLKDSKSGWVTAEYGMLPRSTQERMPREAARGKQSGRTQEIQRLIARSLRAAVDLEALSNYTVVVDCDVIEADGGTRTASITGGCVALYQALQSLYSQNKISRFPFKQLIAAISVGIIEQEIYLDLDYSEDSKADTDMNVVMTEKGTFIEIQGTAEKKTFTQGELSELLIHAEIGIHEAIQKQKEALHL